MMSTNLNNFAIFAIVFLTSGISKIKILNLLQNADVTRENVIL